tara:strand:+ start:132 stop:377 length:246 start_codon:yes stop_codon:yes gene_type:complete
MRLKHLKYERVGKNQTLIAGDRGKVLLSYGTPVAIINFLNNAYVLDDKKIITRTTKMHIDRWLGDRQYIRMEPKAFSELQI